MNKLFKHIVGIFIIGIGILNICNAKTFTFSGYVSGDSVANGVVLFSYSMPKQYNKGNEEGTSKIKCQFTGNANGRLYVYRDQTNTSSNYTVSNATSTLEKNVSFNIMSMYYMTTSSLTNYTLEYNCEVETTGNFQGSCDYSNYITQTQCNEQYSGYIEQNTINSEYCINHNLCYSCPTINKGYCKNEYNLIEPSECPICEGTGQINWSSLYINGTQYNSNEIIDIHTEQQMQTSIEYSNTVADIDISYGQDEEYLDNVISYTQMTPTNDDLAILLSNGLETYAPYLFIGLLLIFTIAIIKKFFRG